MEISLFLFLVSGRSRVIALRGSYNEDYMKQEFRWSQVKT
jgi:hypothetical protein